MFLYILYEGFFFLFHHFYKNLISHKNKLCNVNFSHVVVCDITHFKNRKVLRRILYVFSQECETWVGHFYVNCINWMAKDTSTVY